MSTKTNIAILSTSLLAGLGLTISANADPLPGETLKFEQLPLSNTPIQGAIYNGHDEPSTAYQGVNSQGLNEWQGSFAADDFADNFSTPLVHLKWWGGYINNPNANSVNQFLITFESDVPAGPNGPSHPGTPLLNQIVTSGPLSPGSGTFVQTQPNTALPLFQYNAELNLGQDFPEQKDTVYWVKIVALTSDTSLVWGWHNRDYTTTNLLASPVPVPGEHQIGPASLPMWHFQDDAVRGQVDINTLLNGSLSVAQQGFSPLTYVDNIDGPGSPTPGQGVGGYSEDLAFDLYTTPVPEPAPAAISILGTACALLMRRRRKQIAG